MDDLTADRHYAAGLSALGTAYHWTGAGAIDAPSDKAVTAQAAVAAAHFAAAQAIITKHGRSDVTWGGKPA